VASQNYEKSFAPFNLSSVLSPVRRGGGNIALAHFRDLNGLNMMRLFQLFERSGAIARFQLKRR
jgi:hypothetical protein